MYSLDKIHCIYLLLVQLCFHTFQLGTVCTHMSWQKSMCLDYKEHNLSFLFESTSLLDKGEEEVMVKEKQILCSMQ